jgi:sirohydrochlorin cobaltochelatase
MSTATKLKQLLDSGIRHIGEIEIQTTDSNNRFKLFHHLDAALARESDFGGLEVCRGADDAREISTYSQDGIYRFAKAETSLKRGWIMLLETPEELRTALDQFYPAAVGLHLASLERSLETENLRDKLNRQTGMYRFARSISDNGAQQLVREVCGPAHQCARKILWQLDADTPLDDSEASRFNGVPSDVPEIEAIPLLCREACNHFVAECRKTAKKEHDLKA